MKKEAIEKAFVLVNDGKKWARGFGLVKHSWLVMAIGSLVLGAGALMNAVGDSMRNQTLDAACGFDESQYDALLQKCKDAEKENQED